MSRQSVATSDASVAWSVPRLPHVGLGSAERERIIRERGMEKEAEAGVGGGPSLRENPKTKKGSLSTDASYLLEEKKITGKT